MGENDGMTVISVPPRLRVAACTLFLCIPLIAVEVLIVSRAPGWNLPYRRAIYWATAYSLIAFPLVSWILAAKRLAFFIALVLGAIWILTSASLAIRLNFPSLGFFTVGLFGLLVAQLYWIRVELNRSFLDPGIHWYQGLPSRVPGLFCNLGDIGQEVELRVSRIDLDGAFVFCKPTEVDKVQLMGELALHSRISVTLRFRDRVVQSLARPILVIDRGMGLGIQFMQMSADSKKEVGDFVESLRGEGYV